MFQNIAKVEIMVEKNAGKVLLGLKRLFLVGMIAWIVVPIVIIMLLVTNTIIILALS